MPSRIREEAGIGLIELLVAMLVLSIGIFALVAGFSSGFGSINRASKASTAAVLVDAQMEKFRTGGWSALPVGTTTTTPLGADGRTYWMQTVVELKCPDDTTPTGPSCVLNDIPPLVPPVTSRPVRKVTFIVKDGSASGPLLITESSTFDQAIG